MTTWSSAESPRPWRALLLATAATVPAAWAGGAAWLSLPDHDPLPAGGGGLLLALAAAAAVWSAAAVGYVVHRARWAERRPVGASPMVYATA